MANSVAELEHRVSVVEGFGDDIRDIRGELKLIRAALNNHTDRLDSLDSKVDILVDSMAEVVRMLRTFNPGT